MFGLAYDLPRTTEEFAQAYQTTHSRYAPTLIEVRTDRAENTELHRKLLSKISEATG
jgi:2-succinyl-5-enolpyruvyl-6-hydroxy-3-cyclohexene-1-carboxylate synthase